MIDTPNTRESLLLLGQIDGKLSALFLAFGDHRSETQARFAKHEAAHEDHDVRIEKVERLVWLAALIASGVGAVAMALLTYVLPLVGK